MVRSNQTRSKTSAAPSPPNTHTLLYKEVIERNESRTDEQFLGIFWKEYQYFILIFIDKSDVSKSSFF